MKKGEMEIRRMGIISANCSSLDVKNSFLILEHTHGAAKTLLRAFDIVRKRRRGGSKGGTTDQEQDILRAMLVLSAAGVDAMIKQLIRDALPLVLSHTLAAQQELKKFIQRKVRQSRAEINSDEFGTFLTNLILAKNVKEQAIAEDIAYLTSSSLQSAEELIRAATALGVTQDQIDLDANRLKGIFISRNQIIHELDVKLGAIKRNRRIRQRPNMIGDSNYLLNMGEKVTQRCFACQQQGRTE